MPTNVVPVLGRFPSRGHSSRAAWVNVLFGGSKTARRCAPTIAFAPVRMALWLAQKSRICGEVVTRLVQSFFPVGAGLSTSFGLLRFARRPVSGYNPAI